jgi:Mg2+ and Co2+ transporter CorA
MPNALIREGQLAGAVTIIDAEGVQHSASIADLGKRISNGRLFWLDICGAEPSVAKEFLAAMGVDDAGIERTLRFGQAGRITIGREGIRGVTWLSDPPHELIELHFRSSPTYIFTIWSGDPRVLDDARREFADRAAGMQDHPYHAAAIVLQLLHGTLYHALGSLDEAIHTLSEQVRAQWGSIDFTDISRKLETLRAIWLRLERYAAAVRAATVGVELIAGISARGVDELDQYTEIVEDLASRLSERVDWGSVVVQDYKAALAQWQSQQISRLTVVSVIFLPITFLTGFFGMNFGWITSNLSGLMVFLTLGVFLPFACAIFTIIWFRRRGLL